MVGVVAGLCPPCAPERLPALDGLRGLAIAAVVLFHVHLLPGGWAGVDLFFALSGYLITGTLLRTRGRPGYWARFVSRRARRILPLYALVLLGAWGLRAAQIDETPAAPWWVFLMFGQNYWVAVAGTFGTPLLGATWSLAVEEQFYVVWPLVVRVFGRDGLALLCLALLVCAPILRSSLVGAADTIYVLTPCRIDALAAGALGALCAGRRATAWVAGAAALVGVLAICGLGLDWYAQMFQVWGYSALALCFGGIVTLAGEVKLPGLTSAPLRALGRISYALYLFHGPAIHFLGVLIGPAVAVVLAAASWRWVEGPINNVRPGAAGGAE